MQKHACSQRVWPRLEGAVVKRMTLMASDHLLQRRFDGPIKLRLTLAFDIAKAHMHMHLQHLILTETGSPHYSSVFLAPWAPFPSAH